jgi:hypothetical protein
MGIHFCGFGRKAKPQQLQHETRTHTQRALVSITAIVTVDSHIMTTPTKNTRSQRNNISTALGSGGSEGVAGNGSAARARNGTNSRSTLAVHNGNDASNAVDRVVTIRYIMRQLETEINGLCRSSTHQNNAGDEEHRETSALSQENKQLRKENEYLKNQLQSAQSKQRQIDQYKQDIAKVRYE